MTDAPGAKRRRTDADADAEPQAPPLVRSTEYWFDDGNIILQVESTQFRVAKSVLSRHSSVFRDMFALPLPADEPTVEGCPVVVLPGDTAQDWKLFLGVLYPKTYSTKLPTIGLITAMLRLSKKYDFPLLREECVRRMKQEFPTTLKKVLSKRPSFQQEGNMALGLVSLARETGLHSVLPQLYYSIVSGQGLHMHAVLDSNDTTLSTPDRVACLTGAIKLLELQSTTTLSWLDFKVKPPHIPSETCTRHDKCAEGAKAIFLDIANPRPAYRMFGSWNEQWDTHLCGSCRGKAKQIYNAGRETCWKQLPAAFGLPDWEELKALDFE
ncbi:hypothetical protein C8F04DRAFT_1393496 [Mycena alexandri]|uniref:BTB domain-containing protein n=1 Tax=Mycena alexandri TaxID=1745969 RepID=A0AAD6T4U2_9AGAR|nr:hypothetical protein C8F04DRAFT_1393496 [Mycena alexandri]